MNKLKAKAIVNHPKTFFISAEESNKTLLYTRNITYITAIALVEKKASKIDLDLDIELITRTRVLNEALRIIKA